MKALPHHYLVDARNRGEVTVTTCASGKPDLAVAPPAEFDGPGDAWSPEELFLAALANCFILTFRAMASASKIQWQHLECRAEGILDRVGKHIQFSHCILMVDIVVDASTNQKTAQHLLEKAKENCFISNSLKTEVTFEAKLTTGGNC